MIHVNILSYRIFQLYLLVTCLKPGLQVCSYIMARTSYIQESDDDVFFVGKLDLFSASSLKQQSVSRHVTPTHYLDTETTSLCSLLLSAV